MLAGLVGSRTEQSIKIIQEAEGYYLFFYYQYFEHYPCRPVSLDDMINGLLHMQTMGKLKELK